MYQTIRRLSDTKGLFLMSNVERHWPRSGHMFNLCERPKGANCFRRPVMWTELCVTEYSTPVGCKHRYNNSKCAYDHQHSDNPYHDIGDMGQAHVGS